jgi:glutamine amidotransferase-like uncharacterized protein
VNQFLRNLSFFVYILMLSTTHAAEPPRPEKKIVYVYSDEGAGKESLNQTIKTFATILNKMYSIQTIKAEEVKKGHWIQNAALFILPGGADLPYVKKLRGTGNHQIKKYVAEGGSFLGICAGSYYGSSYVEFDKSGPLEVLGDRELKFFSGKAIGPVLAPYDYKTQSGSRAAELRTTFQSAQTLALYYNGGGFFENAEGYPNTKVLAYYANRLPAIISTTYGKGNVILSGVHFEYDPGTMSDQDQHIKPLLSPLRKSNTKRLSLITEILKILNIETIHESKFQEANTNNLRS